MGKAVGGKAGALSSLAVDTNNRQLHFVEAQVLTTLQKDKTRPQQQRLSDAACALVKCAEGVPPSDENYTELLAKQQRGEAYQAEQTELLASGLFGQSNLDVFNDFLLRNDFAFVKGEGLVRVVGGSAGVVGGTSLALAGGAGCVPSAGLSCAGVPAGLAVVGFSGNEVAEGVDTLFTDYTSTIGQDVLNSFNVATHPGDRNRSIELGINIPILVGEGLLARVGGKTIVRFFEKRFGKGDLVFPNKITLSQTRTLKDIGVTKANRRAFFEGKTVDFNFPTKGGDDVVGFLQLNDEKLTSQLFSINNTAGGAPAAFRKFVSDSTKLAKSLSLKKIEIQGGSVINPDLAKALLDGWFTPKIVPVPEALGGGTQEVLSKIINIKK